MVDVLTADQRKLNMSRIRNKDTAPEMLLRRGLHKCGLRFRLHRKELPGCPDLVFPMFRAVIFVNGCFWHGHDCPKFKLPATRTEFWAAKIAGNQARDARNLEELAVAGWRALVIWECTLIGPERRPVREIASQVADWLRSESPSRGMMLKQPTAGPSSRLWFADQVS